MKQKELNEIAKNIIKENIYLTLATTKDNLPWSAPLFYAIDKKCTFYFISQLDSLHTKHLLKNPAIAFSIFDSHQKEGRGNGVQGSGKAYLLPDEDIREALKWYHTTFIELKPETFKAPNPYRFFKLIPDHFYILDPDANVDKRVEVFLKS